MVLIHYGRRPIESKLIRILGTRNGLMLNAPVLFFYIILNNACPAAFHNAGLSIVLECFIVRFFNMNPLPLLV